MCVTMEKPNAERGRKEGRRKKKKKEGRRRREKKLQEATHARTRTRGEMDSVASFFTPDLAKTQRFVCAIFLCFLGP